MENTGIDSKTDVTANEAASAGVEQVTMTTEEFQAYLQRETDKRVTSALKTARSKWESELGTKVDTHFKDYERKAQMTPEQLKSLELDEKFKQLEAKEKEYTKKTREVEIAQRLGEKKLSAVLTKFVYNDNMDEVEQNIATLEQLVLGMVNEEVEKRIASSKPRAVVTNGLNAEKFRNMGLAERSALYQQNPQLFKELAGN